MTIARFIPALFISPRATEPSGRIVPREKLAADLVLLHVYLATFLRDEEVSGFARYPLRAEPRAPAACSKTPRVW